MARVRAQWTRVGHDGDLAVLHCVSAYPTPPHEAQLRAIPVLADRLEVTVGYSDHVAGIDAAVAAVALGARVIEKHFTLDKNYSAFRDHQLSADPADMRALVERTQESVSFHVRQGEQRLVLFRIDSPQLLRDHARAGDLLPLDRGAGGRVLMACAGAKGRLYQQIRRDGYAMLAGDRVPGLVGISAPVWRPGRELVGALTLTMPEPRVQPSFVDELRAAAARLTRALGGADEGPGPD